MKTVKVVMTDCMKKYIKNDHLYFETYPCINLPNFHGLNAWNFDKFCAYNYPLSNTMDCNH